MSDKLKLFAVKLSRTGEVVRIQGELAYFDSKREAKHVRDKLAHEADDEYAVILGPDHRRFQGAR